MPREALPGLKTVGFWHADHAQDWGLDWHRNEGIELTFLETGRLAFHVGGHDVTLKPGDLTVTRPWQLHRVGDPNVTASRLHWVILDVGVRRPHQSWTWPPWLVLSRDDVRALTRVLRQNEQPVWHAPDDLRACVRKVAQTVEGEVTGEGLSWLTLHLNEMFLLFLRACRRSDVPLDDSLSTSLRTVELFLQELAHDPDHLAREWTLPRMAAQCGLGVTRFVHHCRQLTDLTPMQFLNAQRLETAGRLLADDPGRSVTEVATGCGFSSSQYFATLFGRHFGRTPTDHRDRAARPAAGRPGKGRLS